MCGPAVPEEACGDEEGAWEEEREAELGDPLAIIAVFLFQRLVDGVVEAGGALCANEVADSEGDVVEAGDADGFVIDGSPEVREGGEDNVNEAVEVSDVEGEDLDDGLGAEEDERADEGSFEDFGGRPVQGFPFGVIGGVSRGAAEFLGFDGKDSRRVSFS